MPAMTLYGSGTSPFVRHVRIVIGEAGLEAEVAFIAAEGSPIDPPGERTRTPLRKIPFLEMSDGSVVYDSRVIIEALLMRAPTPSLAAADGPARIETLTRQALALGLCDSAVGAAYERRLRPEEKHWPEWIEIQLGKVASALDAFEKTPPPADRFDLGDSALTAALTYLDVRYPDRPWREGRPSLAAFFERARVRPAVLATH